LAINQTVTSLKNTSEISPNVRIFCGEGTHNVKKWYDIFTLLAGQTGASKLVLVVRQLVPKAYKHDVLVAVNTSLTSLYTFVVGIARPAKVCEGELKEWLAFG
jgi:hypothetical protein